MLRKRSNVSLFYEVLDTTQAKSIFCQALISIKRGTTNNLSRHIKAKHPALQLNERENYRNKDVMVQDVSAGLNCEEEQSSALNVDSNAQSSSLAIKPALKKPGTDIRGYCVLIKL